MKLIPIHFKLLVVWLVLQSRLFRRSLPFLGQSVAFGHYAANGAEKCLSMLTIRKLSTQTIIMKSTRIEN